MTAWSQFTSPWPSYLTLIRKTWRRAVRGLKGVGVPLRNLGSHGQLGHAGRQPRCHGPDSAPSSLFQPLTRSSLLSTAESISDSKTGLGLQVLLTYFVPSSPSRHLLELRRLSGPISPQPLPLVKTPDRVSPGTAWNPGPLPALIANLSPTCEPIRWKRGGRTHLLSLPPLPLLSVKKWSLISPLEKRPGNNPFKLPCYNVRQRCRSQIQFGL